MGPPVIDTRYVDVHSHYVYKESVKALERAIQIVGTQAELARRIKTRPQVIQNWRGRGIPAERVLDVERATGGQVSRHDLRPDLYPREAA